MSDIKIAYLREISNADEERDRLAIANKGLFFHSSARINFLKQYLNAEDLSIAACVDGRLVGYLNMLAKQGPLGKVANSSPFFGSNGGIIVDLTLPESQQIDIKLRLIDAYYRVERENDISLTCIITNPLYSDEDFYRQNFIPYMEDYRIGQLTPLPISEEAIFPLIHSKTRNLVRKAQKFGFDVHTGRDKEDVDFLWNTHKENMEDIGGKAKEKDYFEKSLFHSDYPWELWIASYKDEKAAAMLLYKYGSIIEYVTPVIKLKYRSEQPLSLLIFEAMKRAIKNGATWWNWGGTWKTQDGVYHFKNRWGAVDKNYYYFIRFSKPEACTTFTNSNKETLLSYYNYFFTIPFSKLCLTEIVHDKC
jgi:hypothetical protein